MSKSKDVEVWFPLYIADYMADTTRLTTEQHGAYLLLIMDYWRNGSPPDDDGILCNITKLSPQAWKKHKPALAKMFRIENGVWLHKRIDKELEKATLNHSTKKEAGKKGGSSKWGSDPEDANKLKRSERLANARQKGTHTPVEWQYILDICDNKCVRCNATEGIVKDHIIPIYQGGSDGIENLQPLCRSCNASKGPDTSDLRPANWLSVYYSKADKSLAKRLAERLAELVADDYHTPAPSPSPINNTHTLCASDEFSPAISELNPRLARAGGNPIDQAALDRVLVTFNPHYENLKLSQNQLYGKLVSWIMSDQDKAKTKPSNRSPPPAKSTAIDFDALRNQPVTPRDITPNSGAICHESST